MKVLVLGGSHFMGRALVESALHAGHDVTTLNRGQTGNDVALARHIRADRTDQNVLREAIGHGSWDAVVDTWSGPAIHATATAELLGPRVGHYGYVSSRSVYTWPIEVGLDESHSVVEANPSDTGHDDYATAKRGSELGIMASFPKALIARAGLILGPHEDVGRLPWWLQRIRRGGEILAPGPSTMKLQYIDARDLAEWMISCAERAIGGVFNAVGPVGHTTMGELLDTTLSVTNSTGTLVWLSPEELVASRVAPWTELPIWVPPCGELAGLHNCNVDAAIGAGLRARHVRQTVEDTWAWLQTHGPLPPQRDRPVHGLDPHREQKILQAYRRP